MRVIRVWHGQRGDRATVGATVTLNPSCKWAACRKHHREVGTPLVETGTTVRTSTVDQDAIANLPINGRRFQDFVTLTPTVQVDTSRGQLSFAGQRGINSNVNIDGADYNQPFFGGIRGGERSNNAFTVPRKRSRNSRSSPRATRRSSAAPPADS